MTRIIAVLLISSTLVFSARQSAAQSSDILGIPLIRYEVQEVKSPRNYYWGDPLSVNGHGLVAEQFIGRYGYLSQVLLARAGKSVSNTRRTLPPNTHQITSMVLNERSEVLGWARRAYGGGCLFTVQRNRSYCFNRDLADARLVWMNNFGFATGYYRTSARGPWTPFVLDKTLIRTIDAPAEPFYPMKINDRNELIGLATVPGGFVPLVLDGRKWSTRGIEPQPDYVFADMDENGKILLVRSANDQARSYFYANGTVRDIGQLESYYAVSNFTYATGLTSNEMIVGNSNGRIFVWHSGVMRPLDDLLIYHDQRFACRFNAFPVVSAFGTIACLSDTSRFERDDPLLVFIPRLLGDFNKNGYVCGDRSDFRRFQRCRGFEYRGRNHRCLLGDFNGNGAVDAEDEIIFDSYYGKTCGTPCTGFNCPPVVQTLPER
jgi:hypothetical protein